MPDLPDPRETGETRRRYDRISRVYDIMEIFSERHYSLWKEQLWDLVEGERLLEVGVGTGKNMEDYPRHMEITAVDISSGMLKRAVEKSKRLQLDVDLNQMDAQALAFPNDTFDTVIATCVFCSVPDPVLGLREVLRVVRAGGRVLLIEHVRSEGRLVGAMMDLVNPLVRQMMGPNINRRTVENVGKAGLDVEKVENLGMGGIFKLISARKQIEPSPTDKDI